MYALACAAALPDRLTGVACVSPSAPLDAPGISVPGATGKFMWLARYAPWALRAVYALLVPRLRRDPERVYRLLASGASESDLRALAQPASRQMAIASVLEAFRSGYRGEVREVAIATRPWGLRFEEIALAVRLWDGDQNRLVPPSHAQYLAYALPNAQLRILSGGAYTVIVDHMEEIVREIVGR